MKIIRYLDTDNKIQYGVFAAEDTIYRLDGHPGDFVLTEEVARVQALLSPIPPGNIYGVAMNYKEVATQLGFPKPENPVTFLKPTSSVQNPGGPIILPRHLHAEDVDFEGELAVIIGNVCKNVPKRDALKYVWGYACALDITARDWLGTKGGGQFCRGKAFDTFCPLGPCMTTSDQIQDPNKLSIKTYLNGNVVQDSNTSDMIFDVAEIIEFLSGSTTLYPGTIILTGTPAGYGSMQRPKRFLTEGDKLEVEIEHIGRMLCTVVNEKLS
jgi:2-keto-4-pentenoate hydratase/2-oxohepta-3-ene-1,7-dioic acid hydratase in catechol pathway